MLAKRCACEYAFNGVMFSAYIMAVSFGLQMNYGMKNSVGMLGLGSMIGSGLSIVVFVVYSVLLFKLPQYFG